MSNLRIRRVNQLVKRQVGEMVRREVNTDTSGLITVTAAEVSRDLRNAKIFYSIVGTPEQRAAAPALLERYRPRIQRLMARSVILKYIPVLQFLPDDSLERGDRVLRIIEELEAAAARAQEPSGSQSEAAPPSMSAAIFAALRRDTLAALRPKKKSGARRQAKPKSSRVRKKK